MEGPESLIVKEYPRLKRPCMVCGIGGWVDGGESATGTVKYLTEKLQAKRFAEIPIERFHVFQVPGQAAQRPRIKIEDGILKEHQFPRNQFFYWVNPDGQHDLVLFLGTEPNLNWEEYAQAILTVAEKLAVSRIYALGAVLDRTPHTREPNISCLCSSYELRDEMQKYGMQFTTYEGPGSFGTTLLHYCQQKELQAATLIARATYYPEFEIVIPHNPKSIRAIVKRLNPLLHLNLDMSDLNTQVEEFEGKLGFMASHNQEFRSYVEKLEKEYVEVRYEEPLEISAEEGVQIAEELLKRKREE